MKKEILAFDNVSVKIGNKTILSDINFSVNKNELVTLIGPNGSGKTTLLRSVINNKLVSCGNIFLKGNNINTYKVNNIAEKISYLAQNSYSDLGFTVNEMVLLGRSPYQNNIYFSKEDKQKTKEAMKKTNVYCLKDRYFASLSGGEKQRVLLARALAQESEILLLDEPTNHLDMYYSIEFIKLIRSLNKNDNLTVIAVLHDINLAYRISDKIGIIKDGKLLAFGKKEDLINKDILEDAYNIKLKLIDNPIYNTKEFIAYDIK